MMKATDIKKRQQLLVLLMTLLALGFLCLPIHAQQRIISFSAATNEAGVSFPLVRQNSVAPILLSAEDEEGVAIAAGNLAEDFKRVTSVAAPVIQLAGICIDSNNLSQRAVIIAGTVGKSPLIDELIKKGKIQVDQIAGKWEATLLQAVDEPFAGIDRALVIAGSDKRGTIYGLYEISRQMGVSPWYYWADVPVVQQKEIYCLDQKTVLGPSKVKYRGIFLNDEAPALSGWVHEQFGGFNHQFYVKVFELLLRLKANYLWPAMWGNAFNTDDTLNPVLADRYGIVMGTSHHEPMLRAQQEWKLFGKGEWNYQTNEKVLQDFWRKGIENMGRHESIVTIGMRGDGDMPMTEGSNISLLEKIVQDQRRLIRSVTGQPAAQTPQLWALYKEVQEYYDKGMRVPQDVTLLLCDDNWGNLRKLPALDAKYRSGGYGVYYHFDYVGDPRNYKWINTNTIERTWEQMHLAYRYGVDRIWIVNVGDLKPMEFPISFFLDFARNPEAITYDDLPGYTAAWVCQQFGPQLARPIAEILHLYSKYNARVKPELLHAGTYSVENYREWDRVTADYRQLARKSRSIYDQLEGRYQDAYFELVDYQVAASANLYEMYRAQALGNLYAGQGRSVANLYGDSVRYFYLQDSLLTYRYNKINAGGKWNHFMDQTHIGYTYWQQPEHNTMPEIREIKVPGEAVLGIAAPDTLHLEVLGDRTLMQERLELFTKGGRPADYKITVEDPGMIRPGAGCHFCGQLHRHTAARMIELEVNPAAVGKYRGPHVTALTISGSGGVQRRIVVSVKVLPVDQLPHRAYIQTGHLVSIDATGFEDEGASSYQGIRWTALPGFGKTAGAVTPMPVNFSPMDTGKVIDNPSIHYRFFTSEAGEAALRFYLSPTLNLWSTEGLQFAFAIDAGPPEVVNINKGFESVQQWRKEVAASIRKITRSVKIQSPGLHTLRIWVVTPGVVLQKMELDFGHEKQSFLGAPASYYHP